MNSARSVRMLCKEKQQILHIMDLLCKKRSL